MKEKLTETSEYDSKRVNKFINRNKKKPLIISFALVVSLMIFITMLFVCQDEKSKNILFKGFFFQSLQNHRVSNQNRTDEDHTLITNINKNIEENNEKDKCITYNENKTECIDCDLGYKLYEGECIINYSFKAIYATKKRKENIYLINYIPNDIIEMVVDGKEVKPCKNFTFEDKGKHIIYVLIDISSVESLSYMFYKINSLVSISFTEKFNTTKIKNMNYLFSFCSSMTNINLNQFDTRNVLDMSYMFSGCPLITNLDVSNFMTKNVVNMNSMFLGCSLLTSIDLSNFNTQNVMNMENMFYGYSNLNDIELYSFNTDNVKYMDGMFYSCSSLISINISHFDVKNVVNMNNMFYGCSKLKEIYFSNLNTENLIDMSFMFSGCSSLTSINFTNLKIVKLKYMIGTFYNCFSLTEVLLPSFSSDSLEDINGLFYGCSSLKSINLNHFNSSNLRNVNYMFYGFSSLTSIDLSFFNYNKQLILILFFMNVQI